MLTSALLPVIDIQHGQVVRGVAGRRDDYRPIESCLCKSSDVLAVARAVRECFGLTQFYVADLDAIRFQRPNLESLERLVGDGFDLLVDAGLRRPDDMDDLIRVGVTRLIAGLESISGPALLTGVKARHSETEVWFSLDLQRGRPLGDVSGWSSPDPVSIALEAVAAGADGVIVLDLAAVGVGSGISTLDHCRKLRAMSPAIRLITGGGVRDRGDIASALESGVDGILVASALHDGSLTGPDVAQLSSRRSKTSG